MQFLFQILSPAPSPVFIADDVAGDPQQPPDPGTGLGTAFLSGDTEDI